MVCWFGIACPPKSLVFLFLPSPTKDKLFSQFPATFTLKDGEPGNISSCASYAEGVKCIHGRTFISLLLEKVVANGKDKEEYTANTCFAGT
jgi:hypothetical protein